MREIKFRGKRKDTGKWIIGVPINTHIGVFIAYEENPHYCSQYGYMEITDIGIVDTETIGQFTGLYDKNHTPIYEGDVLEIKKCPLFKEDNPETQEGDVFWYNGAFRIRDIYSSDWHNGLNNVLRESDVECKIIGNIHDNPELIKE